MKASAILPVLSILVIHYTCTSVGLMLACLYRSSAMYRTNAAKFTIDNIDFQICTHYIYGYALVDAAANSIQAMNPDNEEGQNGLYSQFVGSKRTIKSIKTLLSVGGPNPNASTAFRALPYSDNGLKDFAQNVAQYLKSRSFDGLDVSWEYPDVPAAKNKLPRILRFLRQEFGGYLMLTATCPGLYSHVTRGFDVAQMERTVDYVFVKGYNLHYSQMRHATFSSPLFHKPVKNLLPNLNVNFSVHFWKDSGMPLQKIVLGVTASGRILKLFDSSRHQPGSPITEEVLTGELYNFREGLAYPEVCSRLKTHNIYYDNVIQNPYMVSGDIWIGYEDKRSLAQKVDFVKLLPAAGIFFSSLDEDDFAGSFCHSGRYPLLSEVQKLLVMAPTEPTTTRGGESITEEPKTGDREEVLAYVALVVLYLFGLCLGILFVRLRRRRRGQSRHAD